ncbi:MAG: hypothetical protein IJV17_01430 [Prevotella sp.]|nr:hypothetical protein [Prevotella sp.]
MQQDARNSYRTKQSLPQEFYHSCLGKIIILLIFIVILLVIAIMTVPTNEKMEREMMDNIRECIQQNDSIKGDGIDDAVANFSRIFTEADTTFNDKEAMEAFHKYNKLEIYRHTFYSTARLRNNLSAEGIRVGIGIYNIVIPTVKYSDIILFVSTIKNYNKTRLIDPAPQDEYVGENPNVTEYHYLGDPDQ